MPVIVFQVWVWGGGDGEDDGVLCTRLALRLPTWLSVVLEGKRGGGGCMSKTC